MDHELECFYFNNPQAVQRGMNCICQQISAAYQRGLKNNPLAESDSALMGIYE